MDNLPNLIHILSQDPFNPLLNYNVAKEYLNKGQSASAVSFFLRCAEYGSDHPQHSNEVYSSLLAIAKCFDSQSGREYSVSNTLLQAIAYMDYRPEAYFLLAQFYEKQGQWQECYTFAVMGLGWAITEGPLDINIGYWDVYCLEFTKAVSAYWVGRLEESLTLFKKLEAMDIAPEYREAVKNNLKMLEGENVGV